MKTIKRLPLLLAAALLALAVGAPAASAAEWRHLETGEPVTEPTPVEIHDGTWRMNRDSGIECTGIKADADLLPEGGMSVGTEGELEVDPENCHVFGGGAHCNVDEAAMSVAGVQATAAGNVRFDEVDVTLDISGFLCNTGMFGEGETAESEDVDAYAVEDPGVSELQMADVFTVSGSWGTAEMEFESELPLSGFDPEWPVSGTEYKIE